MRRAELGCYAQQRYGTAWLDMPNTIKAITENPGIDTRFFSMVTDDVTPKSIVEQGHLSRVVRKAIKQGVSPMLAIQMVTINAAQLLEKARWIGTISPGRAADILIVSDLVKVTIDQVYADGRAGGRGRRNGACTSHAMIIRNGRCILCMSKRLSKEDFRIPSAGKAQVRVMRDFPRHGAYRRRNG